MSKTQYNPINDALNMRQRPEDHVQHTTFNLKNQFISTCGMGHLVPFLLEPVMPGDFVKVSGEYLFRFAPMYQPIFTQCHVYVDYYFVPNRILWGISKAAENADFPDLQGWERFISSFDPDLTVPTIDIPLADYDAIATDELISHLGIPTAQIVPTSLSFLRVNVLPFMAYLYIYDEYERNPQLQDRRWFLWLDAEARDYFDVVAALQQYSAIPQGFLTMLKRNWPPDYYTVALPAPQLGANVLVPMVNDLVDFWSDASATFTQSWPTRWRALVDGDPAVTGTALFPVLSGTEQGITRTSTGEYVGLDIQETAATMRQLRYAMQVTEILERAVRTGDRYTDFMVKYFDENPMPLTVDRPQWFGGHKGNVVISDVYATANTTGGSSDATTVGSYSGNAMAVDKIRKNEVKIREHGYIMGILSVIPEAGYQNGLPKHWTYRNWFDYPWEQFALIGDQEMKNYEVMLSLDTVSLDLLAAPENSETWGYVPRGHELRYKNNVVAGQMRTLWTSFHLGRIFDQLSANVPLLGDEFLICNPRVSDVFQIVIDSGYYEHEVKMIVYNDLTIDRRWPKYGVPQTGL